MKEVFGSEYLNSKVEKDQYDESDLMISGYYRFGTTDYDYEKPKGSFRAQLGGTSISLDYSKPQFDKTVEEVLEDYKKEFSEDIINLYKTTRKIDNFVVENKEGCFDLSSAFPGCNVYFNMGEKFSKAWISILDIDNKAIFLGRGDPWTPEGFIILLHEVGHYKDYLRSNPLERHAKTISSSLINERQGSEFDAERFLQDERNAWAFALKDLKPFTKDLDIYLDDLGKEIHGFCLKSYSDAIKEVLGKN